MSAHPVLDVAVSHIVELSGCKLHAMTTGIRGHPTIICIHGWPEFWFAWRNQMIPLAEAGFYVVALDMRGFNKSVVTLDSHSYTFKTMCDDIVELMDLWTISQAAVIGHDWGGPVAWRMPLWHPTRVSAVVGICSPLKLPTQYANNQLTAKLFPAFYYQIYFETDEAVEEFDSNPHDSFHFYFKSSNSKSHWLMKPGDISILPKEVSPTDLLSSAELEEYVKAYKLSGVGVWNLPFLT